MFEVRFSLWPKLCWFFIRYRLTLDYNLEPHLMESDENIKCEYVWKNIYKILGCLNIYCAFPLPPAPFRLPTEFLYITLYIIKVFARFRKSLRKKGTLWGFLFKVSELWKQYTKPQEHKKLNATQPLRKRDKTGVFILCR